MPQTQQDIVLAFHKMTIEKGPTARRYVLNWIYECILMRTKSPALYNNIREKGIFPLPCRATIARYMRKLHPMFGYQGGLTLPSTELANLITAVEYAVCNTMSNYGVHGDMAFTTLQNLNINAGCFVGCLNHTSELTKKIVEYYLMTRMFFAGDMKKQEMEKLKEKSKQKRKSSKV